MDTPQLVLGTMHFGTRVDERTSFHLLDRFVDAGGQWIDTADCYSFWESDTGFGGQSEQVIGRWLARRPGVRERIRIATKVGAEPLVAGGWPKSREGLAPPTVAAATDGSLGRLGVDSVDLLWIHMEDRTTPIEETTDALGALVQHGKTARIGASNHPGWLVERSRAHSRTRGIAALDSVQLRGSYLHPRPDAVIGGDEHPNGLLTAAQLDFAGANGLEIWAYTALMGGSYDRDDRPLDPAYDHPGTARRLAALTALAAELEVTRGQLVLAWLVGGTPSVTPILGGSRPEQLDAALAGVRLVLSPEHRAVLDSVG
jgi:aryl-alcohol dehydrogenase-like predicted oxidoreductase